MFWERSPEARKGWLGESNVSFRPASRQPAGAAYAPKSLKHQKSFEKQGLPAVSAVGEKVGAMPALQDA